MAAADTFTWTGNAPDIIGLNNSNWTNVFNWQDQDIPVNDGTADVIIPDTPRDNSNVNDPWSIKSLTFQGPANLSVNGDPLAVSDIMHNGTGAATFNNSVGVSGTSALWRAANGPMTFNGAITGANALTLQAPQPITFGGSAANTLTGLVTVTEGTLVLSKSSFNGAIAGGLRIIDATARWDADNQVVDQSNEQVSVQNGGLANLNGHDERLGQITMTGGARVESTGGQLIIQTLLLLLDSSEVDLGAGELLLQGSITRTGSSTSTSRVAADLITLANSGQNFFAALDSPAAVELEVAGEITGASSASLLEKQSAGAMRLTGANTYQGGTTISAGTLIVDNVTGSGTGTGDVSVKAGARLTGDGSISGAVALNAATITPSSTTGSLIGSLTIGALSMFSTSEFEVQFNEALPPLTRRDILTVSGNALLNGNLVLENLNASVLPTAATTFTVLDAATLTGSFANVANGARLATVDGSGSFVVNYGLGSSFDATQVVLSSFLPTGLEGDFDDDGDVDGRDFLVWQRGGSPSPLSAGDLAIWRDNFGRTVGAVHAAPEPCAVTLALVALGAAASRRRAWSGRAIDALMSAHLNDPGPFPRSLHFAKRWTRISP